MVQQLLTKSSQIVDFIAFSFVDAFLMQFIHVPG
jgi:hypothetical protein